MKIKLRVKGFKQENEMGCGAAALRSIMDFFGKGVSEENITHMVGGIIDDEGYQGILTIHAAVALHKMGFKVHLRTYDLEILKSEWANINNSALIQQLEVLKEKLAKSRKKTSANIVESMIYLLKNNEDVKIKFPEKEDIIQYLERKLPVLISVRVRTFYGDSSLPEEAGHYVVIIGYDGKNFILRDPYDGCEHSVDESLLLLAWFNNALDSTDFLLAIEPRKGVHQ